MLISNFNKKILLLFFLVILSGSAFASVNLDKINDKIILINCYHCSKYNINTKRLKISHELLDVIAKKLNSARFNIDKKNNISNIQRKDLFRIDKKKYQIYQDEYIKYPGSSNEPFWEIFNNKINL